MFKIFKTEWKKTIVLSRVLVYIAAMVFMVLITGVIISKNIIDINQQEAYMMYLKYNLTFVLMKPFFPAVLILLTASVVAEEYAKGMMKCYLITGVNKKALISGKLLYLFTLTFVNMIIMFVVLTIIGGIVMQSMEGIFSREYFKVFLAYLLTGTGILPIVLIAALIGVITGDFQQTVGISLVVFFVSLVADSFTDSYFFITPTGILSYGSKLLQNIDNKVPAVVVLGVYIAGLFFINQKVFQRKDVVR